MNECPQCGEMLFEGDGIATFEDDAGNVFELNMEASWCDCCGYYWVRK